MTRREQREHIFKLLFLVEFYEQEEIAGQQQIYLEELEAQQQSALEETGESETFGEQEKEALNSQAKRVQQMKKDRTYILEKYQQIQEHMEEIDSLLEHASQGWKKERMGKVELTLLRLAVYEMKYDEDIPVGVAINEAVELAKKFGGDGSSAFINGILAKLV